MAKENKRKYLFYFLCNSFVVMVFFMFSTIYFNEAIANAKEMSSNSLSTLLMIPSVALILFTVFFISYAHSVFIKRRKKEFGLFMMLGMSDKDIRKLLLLENGVVAGLSLMLGLLAGSIFSRLFFLLIMYLLEMTTITFELNTQMFAATIGVFLLVFSIAVVKSLIETRFQQIITIFKDERVSERNQFNRPWLGGIGFLLVVASLLFQYYFFSEVEYSINDGTVLLVGTVVLIVGIYLSISQIGSFLIELARKKRAFYYNRILFLTNIEYKFKQLKGIFMLMITLTMVTIFYTSMLLYFYSSAEKVADERYIFDVSFPETSLKNTISDESIQHLFNDNGGKVDTAYTLEVIDYFEYQQQWSGFARYSFISADQFNEIYSEGLSVNHGEYIRFQNEDPKNQDGYQDNIQNFTFHSQELELNFTKKEELTQAVFDQLNLYEPNFIILNTNDYNTIKKEADVYTSKIHLMNLSDWKDSSDAYYKLKGQLKVNNLNGEVDPLLSKLDYGSEDMLMQPQSKIEDYNLNKKAGGLLFFISSFLGVLFLFSSFMLLYLNVFSNIEQERMNYQKLHKIGMSKKEIKKVVSKELILLFFLAPISGLIIAFSYISIFAKDAGGLSENPMFILNFAAVTGLYLTIQMSYYQFVKYKMMKEIN